jgi:phospholipid/cholesterol/gamma-HCH transport system substrate-binding protein
MPRPIGWRRLGPGLAVTVVLAASLVAIFRYARVGALRGDTLRFHTLTDNAAGLAPGSEVWVGGQKVGLVRSIGFGPPASDTARRVLITADVLAEYAPHVRSDSRAAIRTGGKLIGAPVLMITSGTARSRALVDNDTIATSALSDFEGVTSRAAVASRDFPAIIANVKILAAQLGSAKSTVGAILTSDAGAEQFGALSRRAGRLASQIGGTRGTFGRALHGDAGTRAGHAAAQLDTLRALLASESERLGQFRRDTSLLRSVQGLRNEVTIVGALLAEPRGTAGRAIRDSAVQRQLLGAEAELSALIADIKARPFRYVTF